MADCEQVAKLRFDRQVEVVCIIVVWQCMNCHCFVRLISTSTNYQPEQQCEQPWFKVNDCVWPKMFNDHLAICFN